MTDPSSAQNLPMSRTANNRDAHALFAELDQEIAAAAQQFRRGASDIIEGAFRMGRAMLRMRESRLYEVAGYPSFEAYCVKRHGISAKQSNFYTEPLETFGDEQYLRLLTERGLRATYYLSKIFQISPDAYEWLVEPEEHDTPPPGLTVGRVEETIQSLRQELDAASEKLEAAIQALEREQNIGRTMTGRLQRLEQVNRELVAQNDQKERLINELRRQLTTREPMTSPPQLPAPEKRSNGRQQDAAHSHDMLPVSLLAPRHRKERLDPDGDAADLIAVPYDAGMLGELLDLITQTLQRYWQEESIRIEIDTHIGRIIERVNTPMLAVFLRAIATSLDQRMGHRRMSQDDRATLMAALQDLLQTAMKLKNLDNE